VGEKSGVRVVVLVGHGCADDPLFLIVTNHSG
jgi:hypothetical protein